MHLTGPKIAICETASNVVLVLNSAFTTKDQYFRAAIQEATTAFNSMLQDFGYTQKLEVYARICTKFILHNNIPFFNNAILLTLYNSSNTSLFHFFILPDDVYR